MALQTVIQLSRFNVPIHLVHLGSIQGHMISNAIS